MMTKLHDRSGRVGAATALHEGLASVIHMEAN